jgi:hypothetical protein
VNNRRLVYRFFGPLIPDPSPPRGRRGKLRVAELESLLALASALFVLVPEPRSHVPHAPASMHSTLVGAGQFCLRPGVAKSGSSNFALGTACGSACDGSTDFP